jgi:hypothetical protein
MPILATHFETAFPAEKSISCSHRDILAEISAIKTDGICSRKVSTKSCGGESWMQPECTWAVNLGLHFRNSENAQFVDADFAADQANLQRVFRRREIVQA